MRKKTYFIRIKIYTTLMRLIGYLLGIYSRPVCSVAGIIEKDGKILVLKLSYRDGYALPGGLVDLNENLEEALSREIKEETGLDILSRRYYGSFIGGKEYYGLTAIYIISKTSADLFDSDEGTICWMKPEEIIDKFTYVDNAVAVKSYFRI